MKKKDDITHVAVYLRKSRDDKEADALEKHRMTLLEYVERQKWTYELYEEIGSGESILQRDEMRRLLSDVEDSKFDGVLVMYVDRLSRGRFSDVGMIQETFSKSATLIITPDRSYDWNNKEDEMVLSVLLMGARFEYNIIKEKMINGKRACTKKGLWTCGKPPFPYYYDRNDKRIKIDEEKRPYYRMLVEKYLSGVNLIELSKWLTSVVPTSYGFTKKHWSYVTVKRLLASEVHLGYVCYGQTTGGRDKREKAMEWLKSKGLHEPLKTQNEHEAILARIEKSKHEHPKSRMIVSPISGLLYCKLCGQKMVMQPVKRVNGIKYMVRCEHRYHYEKKCSQKAATLGNEFYEALCSKIINIDEDMLLKMRESRSKVEQYKFELSIKMKELAKHEGAISRLYEMREEGEISKKKFNERKLEREHQISGVEKEIVYLKSLLNEEEKAPDIDTMMKRIQDFKGKWNNKLSAVQKNQLFKTIVSKILYDRKEDLIELIIYYR